MNYSSEESEYNSSDDECHFKPAQRAQEKENQPFRLNKAQTKVEEHEEVSLKPKFVYEVPQNEQKRLASSKLMNNCSKVTVASRKTLMSAYTFKRGTPQKMKKHDPVSLFAQAKQSWNNNKFLKSRADAKEGRKLNLDQRNKLSKIV